MDVLQLIGVAVATLVGETFGTIFGGGSFVTQPALLAAGVQAKMAIANDVASASVSSLAFLWSARKQALVVTPAKIGLMVAPMFPMLAVGAFVGGTLMASMPDAALQWMIIVLCGLGLTYTLSSARAVPPGAYVLRWRTWWPALAAGAGFIIGCYDGLSGAGSGILVILLMLFIFRMDMKTTIYVTNIVSCASLLLASVAFFNLGLLSISLLTVMVPIALIAGLTAGRLTMVLPERMLRTAFGALMAVLLSYLIFAAVAG